MRLAISYITAPSASPDQTAAQAGELLGPFIDRALGVAGLTTPGRDLPTRLAELGGWIEEARRSGQPQPASVAFVTAASGRPAVGADCDAEAPRAGRPRLHERALDPQGEGDRGEPERRPPLPLAGPGPPGPRDGDRPSWRRGRSPDELFAERDLFHQLQTVVSRQGEPIEDLGPIRDRLLHLVEVQETAPARPQESGALRVRPRSSSSGRKPRTGSTSGASSSAATRAGTSPFSRADVEEEHRPGSPGPRRPEAAASSQPRTSASVPTAPKAPSPGRISSRWRSDSRPRRKVAPTQSPAGLSTLSASTSAAAGSGKQCRPRRERSMKVGAARLRAADRPRPPRRARSGPNAPSLRGAPPGAAPASPGRGRRRRSAPDGRGRGRAGPAQLRRGSSTIVPPSPTSPIAPHALVGQGLVSPPQTTLATRRASRGRSM